MPERRAWLSLGSNLGDRAALIGEAIRRLGARPGIRVAATSALYRTAPWGDPDQGAFLNAAVAVRTVLEPHAFLESCLGIERELGRVRTRRWGPRAIDIDVLHMDGVALRDERLTLPHPLWRERAFVLVPLAEIAPDLVIGGTRVAHAAVAVDASGVDRFDAAADGPAEGGRRPA